MKKSVFEEAFFNVTGDYPTPLAVERVLANPEVKQRFQREFEAIKEEREEAAIEEGKAKLYRGFVPFPPSC